MNQQEVSSSSLLTKTHERSPRSRNNRRCCSTNRYDLVHQHLEQISSPRRKRKQIMV